MLGKIEGGREGDDRGWDGWMASLTQWTWIWASSGSWWWTRRPSMLQSMGSQRVGHDWATELNWTDPTIPTLLVISFFHWIAFISLLKLNWSHVVGVFLYTLFSSIDLFVYIDTNTIHLNFCSFLVCAVCYAESLSHVWLYRLPRLLCLWGFSRQEYWSGLPCPPPGDLPNPGIEPRSPTL